MAPWDGDGEAGNSFWKGVEIIDVLLTAGIWTICVDGSRTFPTGTVSGRYDNSSLRKAGQW